MGSEGTMTAVHFSIAAKAEALIKSGEARSYSDACSILGSRRRKRPASLKTFTSPRPESRAVRLPYAPEPEDVP